MSEAKTHFLGTWLLEGQGQGQDFSHHSDQYDHAHADGSGSTAMRHVMVEQEGQKVGVWVPSDWSDDQAREALETNW